MEAGPVVLSAGSSSVDSRSTAKFIVTGTAGAYKVEDCSFLSVATVGS
jgi:hypothetical protein